MKRILNARKRIDFAMVTFAQSSGIDDAMIPLRKAKRPISGVLDNRQANQKWTPTKSLKKAGVKLFVAKTKKNGPRLGKLHHKLMVLDQRVVIAGSFNYTGPVAKLNDENIVILGHLEETRKAFVAAQKKLARYASDEIDRIIKVFGKAL